MSVNIQKIQVISALVAISSLFGTKALSQTKLSSVSSVLNSPVDGEEVTLEGKIIDRQTGELDYTFTDGTNTIIIELEESDYPYNPDTTVRVTGIVDFESQHPEEAKEDSTPEDIQIDVDRLQVVTSEKTDL